MTRAPSRRSTRSAVARAAVAAALVTVAIPSALALALGGATPAAASSPGQAATWSNIGGASGDPSTSCGTWFVSNDPPPNTTSASLVLSGGGGGGALYFTGNGASGGQGGQITIADLVGLTGPVSTVVGCGGGAGAGSYNSGDSSPGNGGSGFASGGQGGNGNVSVKGGGGGGASALCLGTLLNCNDTAAQAYLIAVAAGGGGAGAEYDGCIGDGNAGSGGAGWSSSQNSITGIQESDGTSGNTGNDGDGGGGGTSGSGGSAGAGDSDDQDGYGGNNSPWSSSGGGGGGSSDDSYSSGGGGAGGGYTGGGGGGGDSCETGGDAAGGGGGGSSAVNTSYLVGNTGTGTVQFNNGSAGGTSTQAPNLDYEGAYGIGNVGSDGSVTLDWTPAAPTISSVLPDEGSKAGVNAGSDTVTITGTNLAGDSDNPVSVTVGGAPLDITSDSATQIVGTVPPSATAGPADVMVTTDGGPVTAVDAYTYLTPPAVTTGTLPTGTVGLTYPATALAATGGAAPYTWAAAGLPTGLSVDSTTGEVTGVPTEGGTFDTKFTATDAIGQTGSATIPITLTQSSATVSVTATPASTTYGSAVQYSATATGAATVPTGTVDFSVGTTSLCRATLDDGAGSCYSAGAPGGASQSVLGVYSGDPSYLGTTATTSLSVAPDPSVTTVAVSQGTTTYGSSVTYTATVNSSTGTPAGTVAFSVGSTPLCVATTADGQAGCVSAAAPPGIDQTVTAVYSGSANYGTSSGTTALTVSPGSTATTVQVAQATDTFGSPVTYSAVVSATAGTPSGTVTFTAQVTGDTLCAATLSGGAGSCTTSATPPYPGQIVEATYSGAAGYGTSTGSALITVTRAPTSVAATVVSSTSIEPTVVYGHSVTYQATVTPTASSAGTPLPSGTVTFTSNGAPVCTATISTIIQGFAACSAPATSGGQQTVTASYGGDADFNGSSGTTGLLVTPAAVSMGATGQATQTTYGDSVTYQVQLDSQAPTGSTPTGSVTFTIGSTVLCTAAIDPSNGYGTCAEQDAPAGSAQSVAATYSGDANFSPLTATLVSTLTVAKATSTTATTPPVGGTYGSPAMYTATVTPEHSGTATGQVAFSDGPTDLCRATLVNGTASCTTAATPAGTGQTVVATYEGDANVLGSAGTTTFTVDPAATTTTATASPQSSTHGAQVALEAHVTSTAGTPTGAVSFTAGATVLCVSTLSGGVATCTTTTIPVGADQRVLVTYSGTDDYAMSTTTAPVSVLAAPSPPAQCTSGSDPTGAYWLAGANGAVYACGSARYYGSLEPAPAQPIVSITPTLDGNGYWLAGADGAVYAFGDATYLGSMGGKPLNEPIVGMAVTPDGKGYWLVASDGGLFAFGDATFWGSMGGQPLNEPVVGVGATAQGGYYEVASDGGIFSFGPGATFYGSMGGKPLNKPVVGLAVTAAGGYYEVASDGGIFSFGPGAVFLGSMGGKPLNAPVVAMAVSASGGYYQTASDGGIFNYGGAQFAGSTGGQGVTDIVGMATS